MRQRETEVITAVHSEDVLQFFESLGLLQELQNGGLLCAVCGSQITVDNFRAAIRKEGGFLFCCTSQKCAKRFPSQRSKMPRSHGSNEAC